MARILLCSTCILISFLMTGVKCQEEESSGGGFWSRFREIWKNFVKEVKKAWNELTDEIQARTSDMGAWTQEAWNSFKQTMRDWVNDRADITEEEKTDMRNFIERLQMPEDEESE